MITKTVEKEEIEVIEQALKKLHRDEELEKTYIADEQLSLDRTQERIHMKTYLIEKLRERISVKETGGERNGK